MFVYSRTVYVIANYTAHKLFSRTTVKKYNNKTMCEQKRLSNCQTDEINRIKKKVYEGGRYEKCTQKAPKKWTNKKNVRIIMKHLIILEN